MAGQESLEDALGAVFSDEQPAAPAPESEAEAPDAVDAVLEPPKVEAEAEAEAEPEEEVQEPELEIEVDGNVEVIRGEDKIREFVTKGVKAGRVFEEVARVRDALNAQAQIQTQQFQFQQAVMGDIAELRALDQQLEQWQKLDWGAAFDTDPFNAMKLKEQRDTLRELRNNKFQELTRRQQEFLQGQEQAAKQSRAAEEAALLAKLPEWRNSEKATAEKRGIAQELATTYGFNESEIQSIMDHRMLVVARDAYQWRQLQAGKAQGLKQVRAAPPVVKPGAPSAEKGKLGFLKFRQEVRKQGKQGNHRAQEDLVVAALNRSFKI